MIYIGSNGVLLLCLVFAGEFLFFGRVHSEKTECVKKIKRIDQTPTFSGFIALANMLVPEKYKELGDEQIAEINKCLRSVDGQSDVTVLRSLVWESFEIRSVCEPEFVDKLLQYDRQIKNNATRGKYLKRKQKHRFSHFFRLFTGQVILVCKRSLIEKLELAEKNKDVSRAMDRISLVLARNESPHDLGKATNVSTLMRRLLILATKYAPNIVTKIENLVLIDSLKPEPDAEFSLAITVNSGKMLEEFLETKKACKLIDEYAQSSMYAIARLAWRGYMARNELDPLEINLTTNRRVQIWLRSVQYCQGVLFVQVTADLEQESLIKFSKVLNDEKILTVELARDQQSSIDKQDRAAHKYTIKDTVTVFDSDIKCYTYSQSFKGWFLNRLGKSERLMAKLIKLNVMDESYKQSMLSDLEDPENEVQFGGTSAVTSNTFSQTTAHFAAAGHHGLAHHNHYLGGSPNAEFGILFACAVGTILLLFIFSLALACWDLHSFEKAESKAAKLKVAELSKISNTSQ